MNRPALWQRGSPIGSAACAGGVLTRRNVLAAGVGALVAPSPAAPAIAAGGRKDTARQIAIAGLRGSAQNPCWLPGDGGVAFTNFLRRYNTGNAIVRVVPPAGGAPTRTYGASGSDDVNLPGQCRSAALNLIAFSSGADNVTDEIYVADLAGGAARRVTNRPANQSWEPSFSPVLADGSSWIVFESHNLAGSDPGEIWKVNADGSGLARLTGGHDDRQPEWSPAGNRIVFQRASGSGWDVMTIDPHGGSLVNLTRDPSAGNTDPSWSPSGRYVVYSAGGDGIAIANLWIIPAVGGVRRRLTTYPTGYDGAPGWSNNGRLIAFESAPADPDGSGSTSLWVIAAPAGVA